LQLDLGEMRLKRIGQLQFRCRVGDGLIASTPCGDPQAGSITRLCRIKRTKWYPNTLKISTYPDSPASEPGARGLLYDGM
jgi:hypothetical protein